MTASGSYARLQACGRPSAGMKHSVGVPSLRQDAEIEVTQTWPPSCGVSRRAAPRFEPSTEKVSDDQGRQPWRSELKNPMYAPLRPGARPIVIRPDASRRSLNE